MLMCNAMHAEALVRRVAFKEGHAHHGQHRKRPSTLLSGVTMFLVLLDFHCRHLAPVDPGVRE